MANRKQKRKEEVKFYFAYGSNLNHEHMKFRCPKAKFIRKMTLPNYELVFRSVADIQDAPGKWVEGGLFRITDDCEKALDTYEGYPHLYTKKYYKMWHDDLRSFVPQKIMFYSMVDKDVVHPPSEGYLRTIMAGYNDCEISTDALMKAVNESLQALDNWDIK